jgi:hypothetical protein
VGAVSIQGRMSILLFDLAVRSVLAAWVFTDVRKRAWDDGGLANKPWVWALGVGTIWYVALPLYLLRRRKRTPEPLGLTTR